MRLLIHNVRNYPEVLESSMRSSECLLFFVISIDNDLIYSSGCGGGENYTPLFLYAAFLLLQLTG